GRDAAAHPVRERLLAERHRDHEMAVDVRGVADRHDVRMLELRRETRLALEVDEEVVAHAVLVRHLERDAHVLDRVERLIHGRDRAVRDAPFDAVLTEFLSSLQHRRRNLEMLIIIAGTSGRYRSGRQRTLAAFPPCTVPRDAELLGPSSLAVPVSRPRR